MPGLRKLQAASPVPATRRPRPFSAEIASESDTAEAGLQPVHLSPLGKRNPKRLFLASETHFSSPKTELHVARKSTWKPPPQAPGPKVGPSHRETLVVSPGEETASGASLGGRRRPPQGRSVWERWFESWLPHCCSSSLFRHLGKQRKMARVPGPLHSHGGPGGSSRLWSWCGPAWAVADIWGVTLSAVWLGLATNRTPSRPLPGARGPWPTVVPLPGSDARPGGFCIPSW